MPDMAGPDMAVATAPPAHPAPARPAPADRTGPGVAGPVAATVPADHAPAPGGGHGHSMLHLCLAVLAALGLLLAASLLLRIGRAPITDGRVRFRGADLAAPARPPPTAERLARLCVLRT